MSGVRVVEELPVLDQDEYGDLPEIPEGTVLTLFDTPWRRAEPEFMAAAIIQYCMEAGEWKPIRADPRLDATLRKYDNYHYMAQCFWNGLADLRELGDVEVIEYDHARYIVPMPSLAIKALGSEGRVMYRNKHVEPTGSDQPTEPIALTPPSGGVVSAIRQLLGRIGLAVS